MPRRSLAQPPSTGRLVGSLPPTPAPPVLVVTADGALVDRVTGLAAAAGVDLLLVDELPSVGQAWDGARLVLLGADAADIGGEPPGRRAGVVVVVPGEPSPQVWRAAVAVGAERVAVLPEAESWLLDRLVDAGSTAPTAGVVGVVGGRGGAGASTLATALAITAAQLGAEPLLIDGDPFGGGLDLLLGAEDDEGLRWSDLRSVRGRLQPGLLARALPRVDGVRLLSWGRAVASDGLHGDPPDAVPGAPGVSPEALRAVLDAAARESDLVVLDLPRGFDDLQRVALRACSTVLLVVPAEVRATAAAGQVMSRLDAFTSDVRLVVRGPAPTGLTAETIASVLELPLFGELRAEPGLAAALDRGLAPPVRPRGPLAVLCRRLAADLLAA